MAREEDLILALNDEIRACIDHVDELEVREVGGVIRYLKRKARVVNLPHYDFTTLYMALEEAGIPTVPSTLADEGFEMLQLSNRDAKLFNGDASTVDVILEYKHVLDGDNQELEFNPDVNSTIFGRMKCSLKEKKTNRFPTGFQVVDPDTNDLIDEYETISVSYTYPKEHPHLGGKTVVQGGEINVPVPQKNYKFAAYVNVDDPKLFASRILGKVNKPAWLGEDPRTWLCVEIGWQVISEGRYKFEFEFQHDPDTWDNYAVFQDEFTKRPPVDLVFGVGQKIVKYLKEIDFDQYFGLLVIEETQGANILVG